MPITSGAKCNMPCRGRRRSNSTTGSAAPTIRSRRCGRRGWGSIRTIVRCWGSRGRFSNARCHDPEWAATMREQPEAAPAVWRGSAEGRHDLLDKQLQRFLFLGVRQAVVAPETELVDPQYLVIADPRDDFLRRADHGVLADILQCELRPLGELFFRARRQEAVDRYLLVAEPGVEGPIELRDGRGADFPAFRVVNRMHMGVPQHHQLRARHLGIVVQRGLE